MNTVPSYKNMKIDIDVIYGSFLRFYLFFFDRNFVKEADGCRNLHEQLCFHEILDFSFLCWHWVAEADTQFLKQK